MAGEAGLPGGTALGPFELLAPLATGAMATVWRGVHRPTALPVAVKVMTAAKARSPGYVLAFGYEVEAIARLDHPGIVRVYDHGALPAAVAAATEGVLAAGSPYLVMELAQGGSLVDVGQPSDWRTLGELLLALLEALGHAHARGVVHRDLKPGNVLCDARAGAPPRYLLTDFGIAHALAGEAPRMHPGWASSGTPPYMAPEQFSGEWRDHGPWTDLYALGCLVHALATGHAPFRETDADALALAHIAVPPPELAPTFPVPHGLYAWTRTLLAKEPSDRFQRAADAAFALRRLDDTPRVSASSGAIEAAPSSTLVQGRPPPLPADWRAPAADRRDAPLGGAGIGLFGLRSIPLVDREVERDMAWKALADVHRSGRSGAVVLFGPAGSGKSRVARWIAERADEVGGATVLRATHSAQGGTHDGLLAMFVRHLHCQELEGDELRQRIGGVVASLGDGDPHLADVLAELVGRGRVTELVDALAANAEERRRALARLLGLLAAERTLVLLLDDVQWGLEALRLVVHLLDSTEPMPVLALCTVRHEALVPGSLEQCEVEALVAHPRALAVDVHKLGAADHRSLVEQLVGLSPELRDRVAARTGGNALHAVQLVGDWVARGVLAAGERGLELVPGAVDALPEDIHALCSARIARAMVARPAGDLQALELAALLGAEIDESEWYAVCDAAGIRPQPGLVEELSRQGLVEPSLASWRFSHGVVRESLERSARAAGRAEQEHSVIADVLRARKPRTADLAARTGRHLAAANRLHEAHAPLLQAARLLRLEADHPRVALLVAEGEALLDRLGAPSDDPRRCEGELVVAAMHVDAGRVDEAEQIALGVAARAADRQWPVIAAHAALVLAPVSLQRGDFAQAVSHCHAALLALIAYGDRRGEHRARAELAGAYYFQGDHQRAGEAYLENLELAQEVGDELAIAEAHWGLGYVELWRDDPSAAGPHFEAMRAILARHGATYRLARCYNSLAEVARLGGRLTEAEHLYRESLRLSEVYGDAGMHVVGVNLVLVHMAAGDIDACCEELPSVLAACEELGQVTPLVAALSAVVCLRAQLPPEADVAGLPSWDDALRRLARLIDEQRVREGDTAVILGQAAAAMLARGDRLRAAAAARLGCMVWRTLGREERAAALEGLVG
jgi:eukaryotic-like serine/threonine-protein kinase